MPTLENVPGERPYPGRGCVAARTTAGTLVFVYFLTGRSDASRRRELVRREDGDLVVRSTTEGADDPLRHYVAAARRGSWTVVGNGDQVEPITKGLADGQPALSIWADHTFEPDGPIFTSRIWVAHQSGGPDLVVGFARRSDRRDGRVNRVAWVVDELGSGTGVMMTTYAGTASDIVRTAMPVDVDVAVATVEELLLATWQSLSPELRVAAFALTPGRPENQPVFIG